MKKTNKIYFLIFFLLIENPAYSFNWNGCTVSTSETVSLTNETYTLSGTVTVANGATLTIKNQRSSGNATIREGRSGTSIASMFVINAGGKLIVQGQSGRLVIIEGDKTLGSGSLVSGDYLINPSVSKAYTGSPIKCRGNIECNYTVFQGFYNNYASSVRDSDHTLSGTINFCGVTESSFSNCTFRYNVAGTGAGITLYSDCDGHLKVENCIFCFNHGNMNGESPCGATIRSWGPTGVELKLLNTKMYNNYSNGNGGAIYWSSFGDDDANLIFQGCEIYKNYSVLSGGGALLEGRAEFVGENYFHDNVAERNGGGISIEGYSTPQMGGPGKDVTFNLNDGLTVERNCSPAGGGIGVNLRESVGYPQNTNIYLNVIGSKIKNNKIDRDFASGDAHLYGGGIYVLNNLKTDRNYKVSVVLNDCQIIGNEAGVGAGAYVEKANVIAKGANLLISGNKADLSANNTISKTPSEIWNYGGGICVNGGKVELEDGQITQNIALVNGGGAAVLKHGGISGEILIKGSTLCTNNAVQGGAIFITDGKADVDGGEMKGNTASDCGGGIFLNKASFAMTNGSIHENSASEKGGGVYLKGSASFSMSGNGSPTTKSGTADKCAIDSNISEKDGGGVYVEDGTITIENGSISLNTSKTGAGGGIYSNSPSSEVKIKDGTIISANTANGAGGGAYINAGTVSINKGEISKNTSKTNSGGGVFVNSGNLTVENNYLIQENTAAVSGGGIYVGSGKINLKTGDIIKNIARGTGGENGGGGIYVFDAETVKIQDGHICYNEAASGSGGGMFIGKGTFIMDGGAVDHNKAETGLGGGIYVGSGTIEVISGSSSYNHAYDGGGLYAGGGVVSFKGGGQISNNIVSHNGGGVFGSSAKITFEGEHSESSVNEYAEIAYNTAMNGAGIYMTRGANMYVTAALVNGNEAVVVNKDAEDKPTPAIPLSAFWSYTKNPDSNNKQYLQGIGGGVYLDSGVDDSHKTVLEFATNNLVSLGIYSNTAEIAADDIFANGDFTQVIIPAVDDMKFEKFGGKPTGWYEDYMTNDVSYAAGTYENNRNGATGIRYRTAYQSGQNMFKVDNNKASDAGRYICLALGDPFASLVIKVTGLKKGESAVYTCTKYGDDKPTYYVIITGTSDSGEEVSRIINNVPIGDWSIEQTDWSWSYDLSSPKVQFGKVGVDTVEPPTVRFSNTADTSASSHGESIKNNVFSTVVTAVDIVTVTPRDKNNGENNKKIDL